MTGVEKHAVQTSYNLNIAHVSYACRTCVTRVRHSCSFLFEALHPCKIVNGHNVIIASNKPREAIMIITQL